FAIQEEISQAIAEALHVQLAGGDQQLVKPTTDNLEAYTCYLKGRFLGSVDRSGDTIRKALALFEAALDVDVGYAKAYSGIADCWASLADNWVAPAEAYPRAKSAASRAIQLEPGLAEAHTSLGKVLSWYEWDFQGATKALADAVRYNPNYAEAHFVYGTVLPCVGRLDDAIEELRKAVVLDPLSAPYSRWISRFLGFAGKYEDAIVQAAKALDLEPLYSQAYLDTGSAQMALGRYEEALKSLQKGQSLSTAIRSHDAMIVRALAALGEMEEARAIMERLEEDSRHRYVRGEMMAIGYGAIGETDRAFESLDKALLTRSAGLVYLHLDTGYEPLRSDPRFGEFVAKIGIR
ncbi:MAG: tetratricopeptide repeat protein, partial [Gemmatimonadales bacterium]